MAAAEQALARTDGYGLEDLLRALGQSFADHARYASLLLQRPTDAAAANRIRAAIDELTARAVAAGTVHPGVTTGDITALVWAMRGLVQAAGEAAPGTWQRFLDIHLAGLRTAGPASSAPRLRASRCALRSARAAGPGGPPRPGGSPLACGRCFSGAS